MDEPSGAPAGPTGAVSLTERRWRERRL